MTLRDEVWDAALEELTKQGKFKVEDLEFDESQRHTVRRVLKEMENSGWLDRKSDRAHWWRLGPKAKSHLSISPSIVAEAEED